MEFKDRLKQLRNEHGLSAAQLAAQFDKSESAIRMWELGRSKPDADTLIALATCFNCSIDYLLGVSKRKNEQSIQSSNDAITTIVEFLEDSETKVVDMFMNVIQDYIASYYLLRKNDESCHKLLASFQDVTQSISMFASFINICSDELFKSIQYEALKENLGIDPSNEEADGYKALPLQATFYTIEKELRESIEDLVSFVKSSTQIGVDESDQELIQKMKELLRYGSVWDQIGVKIVTDDDQDNSDAP